MSMRTGQTSAQAPQSVDANGSEPRGTSFARQLRLEDRPDRAGVDRVVGVPAGLPVHRADVDAGRAADAAQRVAPDGVRERPRATGVDEHEVERRRPVAGPHARPERRVRVHPLARRRAGQQLEHDREVVPAGDDLLDAHHRDERVREASCTSARFPPTRRRRRCPSRRRRGSPRRSRRGRAGTPP